ncbi:hypothetical protein HK104_005167, partial [Borealophlyctis nickersoniae]
MADKPLKYIPPRRKSPPPPQQQLPKASPPPLPSSNPSTITAAANAKGKRPASPSPINTKGGGSPSPTPSATGAPTVRRPSAFAAARPPAFTPPKPSEIAEALSRESLYGSGDIDYNARPSGSPSSLSTLGRISDMDDRNISPVSSRGSASRSYPGLGSSGGGGGSGSPTSYDGRSNTSPPIPPSRLSSMNRPGSSSRQPYANDFFPQTTGDLSTFNQYQQPDFHPPLSSSPSFPYSDFKPFKSDASSKGSSIKSVKDRITAKGNIRDSTATTTSNRSSGTFDRNKEHRSFGRKVWRVMARIVTIIVPDCFLPMRTRRGKEAWREKVLLCFIGLFTSAAVALSFMYFSPLVCPKTNDFTISELAGSKSHVAINGYIYEVGRFRRDASLRTLADAVAPFVGLDVSSMFPTFLFMTRRNGTFVDADIAQVANSSAGGNWFLKMLATPGIVLDKGRLVQCPSPRGDGKSAPCFNPFNDTLIRRHAVGFVSNRRRDITKTLTVADVVIDFKVYNVASYTTSIASDMSTAFLPLPVTRALVDNAGDDATDALKNVANRTAVIRVLDKLFFAGVTSDALLTPCERLNPLLFACYGPLALILVLRMFAAFFITPPSPKPTKPSCNLIMVPVYHESKSTLVRTFDKIL